MAKSVRTSSRRSSTHNILNFSSDLDQSTRRDSKWWRNLSDRSVRRSLIRNVRYRENENTTLSDGSYPYEDVNSQWWEQLGENESTILQRNAFKNRSDSVVEEDDKTEHESHTEDNVKNVARKMLFTGRQRRSGNHRFSKAFHLEQNQTDEPQAEEETGIHDNGEANNEKNKSAETVAPREELLKRKIKRKTVQLFSRKPYSQRFSEAFHSAEEEKIESEQQDNEEQHSEIIVSATQETHRKSQFGLVKDTLSNIEENIEVNETFAKNKTNLESTGHVEKKNLFSNAQKNKRTFSEAFSKTAVDETCVDINKEPETTEKLTENDTIDTELNQSVEIRKGLFEQKQAKRRKFSEAFSKTKHTDYSIDKSNQELTERISKSFRKSDIKESEQNKNLYKISEDVLSNEQTENIDTVRKSTRISKNNDTNQMEVSKNIQIKPNLFQANIRETRKFSEAFAKSAITEHEIDSDDNIFENQAIEKEPARRSSKQKSELATESVQNKSDTNDENIPARKSLRLSKINETKQMEISERVQTKQDLFKAKVKKTRTFSEAFGESEIIEKSSDENDLSDNYGDNNIVSVNSKMSERKSTRKSENNMINQTDTNKIRQDLFKKQIKENRKFSEAFAKSTFEEKLDNKTNEDMKRNKSTAENKTDIPNESSHLSTLPSINDTVGDDKKNLFKPKARKSLFSVRNTPSRMKKIDENAAVESEPNPQSSWAESTDQNVVFSDSVISRFFETSLISSTKLIINPNLTRRKPTDDSQIEENQNENKNESQNRRSLKGSHISPQGTSMQTENIERPDQESSRKKIDEQETQINKDTSQNKRSLSSNTVQQEISKHKETGEESHQKKQINDDEEEEKNKDRSQSHIRSANIVPQELLIPAEQTEKLENVNTECDAATEVVSEIVNKDVSKIPILRTSSKKIRKSKTLETVQNKSELTNNESIVQSNNTHIKSNKTTAEHECINSVENSETRTGLKNISERATISNEDNSQKSQISPSPGKRSSKFITDDIQTHISNNKSSRVSTTAESTDKTTQEKPETRTSSHKNTSKFNLNDIEKNVTVNKSNRISEQQNSTEIQTIPRDSSLKYSTNSKDTSNADRQCNSSKSKKESVKKSLQSEYGENGISKRLLRFTENYDEIVNENEEKTSNNYVSFTGRVSISLQRNSLLNPIKETELKSKGDPSLKPENVIKTPVDDKKLQKELLLKALNNINPKTPQITAQELPSNKITDFLSKINVNAIPKMTKNNVTKTKPKPIPSALLVNGKIYKPKLFSGESWCNKRFYKYLQDKLQNKYEETTIVESEKLMISIANSAKIILKSKHYAEHEINKLKKELTRHNVISTTFDFFILVEKFLPYDIREKIIPCTRAHYATPTLPYDPEGLYKPIEF